MTFRLLRDGTFDSLSSFLHDKLPINDISLSTPSKGFISYNTTDNNLYYADGTKWIPIATTVPAQAGMIAINFEGSQSIPPGVPSGTQVQLNSDFGTSWPLHSSFTTDTAQFGFVINDSGLYRLNYQLSFTNNAPDAAGNPPRFKSWMRYNAGLDGNQLIGIDYGYADVQIAQFAGGYIPGRGNILQGSYINQFTSGDMITLWCDHDSSAPELVVGSISPIFQGMPDQLFSYMQIEKM